MDYEREASSRRLRIAIPNHAEPRELCLRCRVWTFEKCQTQLSYELVRRCYQALNPKERQEQTLILEERAGIDSVLTNGYEEANRKCERMLVETLHRYPDRVRTMIVRLKQIAGSKTSGYWNPMEDFGFFAKVVTGVEFRARHRRHRLLNPSERHSRSLISSRTARHTLSTISIIRSAGRDAR